MNVQYRASHLTGTVAAPPSKSAAHRMILGAALAALSGNRVSTVSPIDLSEDMRATIGAVQEMGVTAVYCEESLTLSVSPAVGRWIPVPLTAMNRARPCGFSSLSPLRWEFPAPLSGTVCYPGGPSAATSSVCRKTGYR